MIIPTPKTVTSTKGSNKLHVVPPIPFERKEAEKAPKTSYVTFKLRSNPTDSDSPEYDFTMKYFRSGSTEDLLICLKNIRKVLVGMNVTTGPLQYAMVRRVLQGDALSAFEVAATRNGNETVENLKKCFESLKKHVLPVNAYQRQRHYMNRVLRKPRECSIRQFMTRLTELNDYLEQFPNPSATVTATKFSDHELTDIATNAIPNAWIKAMTYHNFDPLIHTPAEFTSFCERIEQVESMSNTQEKISHTESMTSGNGKVRSRSQKGKRKLSSLKDESTGMWCELHQTNTHDTGKCKVLLAQAKKMRETWESNGVAKGTPSKNANSNKPTTWKKSMNKNYAMELGKLMCKIMEQKLEGTSDKSKEGGSEEKDDDDDVIMNEHYEVDAIERFLQQDTNKELIEVEDSVSPEIKKKSASGSA